MATFILPPATGAFLVPTRAPRFFLYAACLLFLCLMACESKQGEKALQQTFTTNNLDSTFFLINNQSDTTIKSPNRTKFHIPKNSFVDEQGQPVVQSVRIEVKEALTKYDMFTANLTTTSDGRMLESDGMLYINASSQGKPVHLKPTSAIQVELQTTKRIPGMQLFTGEKDSLGGINWVNPSKLDTPFPIQAALVGQKLFQTYCVNCHALDDVVVGPPLENVHQRRQEKWLIAFIRNSTQLIYKRDSIATEVFNQYNKTPMPSFAMSDDAIKSILAYITHGAILPANSGYIDTLPIATTADSTVRTLMAHEDFVDEFTYLFEVKKFGWINIDRFPEDKNTALVRFLVEVENASQYNYIQMSLIFASRNVLLSASPTQGSYYSFNSIDPESPYPLPLGEAAFIVTIAAKGQTRFYNIKKVKIGKESVEKIVLKESTLGKFQAALRKTF